MTLKELIEQYSYKNEGLYTLIDIEDLCKEYAKIVLEKDVKENNLLYLTVLQVSIQDFYLYEKGLHHNKDYEHGYHEGQRDAWRDLWRLLTNKDNLEEIIEERLEVIKAEKIKIHEHTSNSKEI